MPFDYGLETLSPAFEDRPIPYIAYGARFPTLTANQLTQTLAANRVFIIAGKALSENTPALTRLKSAIENQTSVKVVGVHIGIAPHTPWDQVVAIANEARTAFDGEITDRDVIITLGGGSITDGAKVIAWILANPNVKESNDLEQYYAASEGHDPEKLPKPVVRVVSIPTTLSGGEYQNLAGVTRSDGSGQKCPFYPPVRNPSLVLLDPDLTTTTPSKVWLSTGVRAIDHCVETLCSLQSNVQADEAAERGLRRLVSSLLRTKGHGHDLEARFESQMGVIEAMFAVSSGVPLGASHAIGHQLGPLGVGHGETSCIMLPAVCKWNAKQGANIERQAIARDILLQTAEVRKLIEANGKTVDDLNLGDLIDLVIRALGMPRTLTDVGVAQDKFDMLAKNTLTDQWAATNATPITTKEQVLEILEMVV
ncbi:hypothetical protein LTR05_001102 [Lithohypha guttulata]|uniref:Alcohol dehydrogenase iron-type/glycerol dehydrogenase GldA domain-containing protein n=1 Tax=Lithohypha guttulata TaxID=1690604 RepID=A0AAN7T5H4_9EURO|nr:hypothetical protein LTR05_001102 [Lithohypha guttulata]